MDARTELDVIETCESIVETTSDQLVALGDMDTWREFWANRRADYGTKSLLATPSGDRIKLRLGGHIDDFETGGGSRTVFAVPGTDDFYLSVYSLEVSVKPLVPDPESRDDFKAYMSAGHNSHSLMLHDREDPSGSGLWNYDINHHLRQGNPDHYSEPFNAKSFYTGFDAVRDQVTYQGFQTVIDNNGAKMGALADKLSARLNATMNETVNTLESAGVETLYDIMQQHDLWSDDDVQAFTDEPTGTDETAGMGM